MKLSDRRLIVVYVGMEGVEDTTYLESISKGVTAFFDHFEDASVCIIPVPDSNEIRVECINPVLLTGKVAKEKYLEMEKSVDRLKNSVDEFIERQKKMKNNDDGIQH